MNAIILVAIGAAEAVVHLWRYRSANRESAWSSGLSCGAVQTLRVAGIGGIAASVDQNNWIIPMACYIASSTLVTVAAHSWAERRWKAGSA